MGNLPQVPRAAAELQTEEQLGSEVHVLIQHLHKFWKILPNCFLHVCF